MAGICECVSKYYRDFRIALRIVDMSIYSPPHRGLCPFIRYIQYVHLVSGPKSLIELNLQPVLNPATIGGARVLEALGRPILVKGRS